MYAATILFFIHILPYFISCQALETTFPSFKDQITVQKCIDGTTIQMGCNTCTCHRNILLCTKMACFYPGRSKDQLRTHTESIAQPVSVTEEMTPEDLAKLTDEEFMKLPKLLHHASDCTPYNLYRIDCNACFCDKERNLICEEHMCVDESTTLQIMAGKKSGKPCKNSFETKDCIKCLCLNGTTKCSAVSNCNKKSDIQMLSEFNMEGRVTFDFTKKECVPNVVYKDKCNRCYCQADKTLRCTRKLCLNHKQALELEEQREFLEKHRL